MILLPYIFSRVQKHIETPDKRHAKAVKQINIVQLFQYCGCCCLMLLLLLLLYVETTLLYAVVFNFLFSCLRVFLWLLFFLDFVFLLFCVYFFLYLEFRCCCCMFLLLANAFCGL